MLSICPIKSVEKASDYCQQDNYYAKKETKIVEVSF
jgi:hypothetical protein